MAAHHRADRGQILRTAGTGVENLADLAELGGPEHRRRRDRREGRVDRPVVLDPVDLTARHADRFAGTDLGPLAINRPGGDALEPVIVSSKPSWLCGAGILAFAGK